MKSLGEYFKAELLENNKIVLIENFSESRIGVYKSLKDAMNHIEILKTTGFEGQTPNFINNKEVYK